MNEIELRAPLSSDAGVLARLWLDTATYYATLNPTLFACLKSVASSNGSEHGSSAP